MRSDNKRFKPIKLCHGYVQSLRHYVAPLGTNRAITLYGLSKCSTDAALEAPRTATKSTACRAIHGAKVVIFQKYLRNRKISEGNKYNEIRKEFKISLNRIGNISLI